MKVTREETFGPVAPLFRFKTDAGGDRMANDTEFGLAAYFYSRDIGRVWRVAEALEYGIVGINEGIISTGVAPFGGVKEIGIGREGSKYGIEEYPRGQVSLHGRDLSAPALRSREFGNGRPAGGRFLAGKDVAAGSRDSRSRRNDQPGVAGGAHSAYF